ncbi:MAG: hypothetical protein L6V95_15300 [Candidatus Melainabacteria bacterium]|nr:MAG: hypothetical protein L6V95_15300 [Candidatus Melainabacteria bacterium]
MKSGLSTSYFMKDSEAFSKIPNKEDILEIQNNLLQTILLNTISSEVLEYTPEQSMFYSFANIANEHLNHIYS